MSKFAWSQVPPTAILIELVQLAVGVACLWYGWLTLPMLYALIGIEVLLVTAISGVIYQQRRWLTMVWDAVKILVLWLFCAAFVVGSYVAAGGFAEGPRVEPRELGVIALLAGLRYGLVALAARASDDPRLAWTREAAMRGAVVALSMLCGAFVAILPGFFIARWLQPIAPEVAADIGIGACLLAAQAFLACVVATMTPQELAAISRQPYADRG